MYYGAALHWHPPNKLEIAMDQVLCLTESKIIDGLVLKVEYAHGGRLHFAKIG